MNQPWLGRNSQPITAHEDFGLMGILNLTPDSFYDGGKWQTPELAINQAKELLIGGADIIDLGAESSRPGSAMLNASEEGARLFSALSAIHSCYPNIPLSVDSWRAITCAKSLELGVSIINDISGFSWDPALIDVLVHYKPGYVLMHNANSPELMHLLRPEVNMLTETLSFFSQKLNFLIKAGLPEECIALDPGIGFGKTLEQNLCLLKNLSVFSQFGRPILIGVSMKSLFGKLLGCDTGFRLLPTAVASVLAWQKGVFWHRVHHPAEIKIALDLAKTLKA